jgi:hypothetical protein
MTIIIDIVYNIKTKPIQNIYTNDFLILAAVTRIIMIARDSKLPSHILASVKMTHGASLFEIMHLPSGNHLLINQKISSWYILNKKGKAYDECLSF